MGFEMTITAQKPALDVMMDGSMNVSVFSSQKNPNHPQINQSEQKKKKKKRKKQYTKLNFKIDRKAIKNRLESRKY